MVSSEASKKPKVSWPLESTETMVELARRPSRSAARGIRTSSRQVVGVTGGHH